MSANELAFAGDSFQICVAVICFFIMIIFIVRMSGDYFMDTSVTVVTQRVPAVSIVDVHNPFIIRLLEPDTTNLSGVQVTMDTSVPSTLQAFWAVPIADLFKELHTDWSIFWEAIVDGTFLKSHALYRSEKYSFDTPVQNKHIELKPPKPVSENDLGAMPRLCYPCVIVVYSNLSDDQETSNQIGALITAIHLRDSVVTQPSHILLSYVKTYRGAVHQLQQLYVSGNDNQDWKTTTSLPNSHNRTHISTPAVDDRQWTDCVVCQTSHVTHVILPCRHACACQQCFQRLDKCPICRGYILSYFMINKERDRQTDGTEQTTSDTRELDTRD